MYATLTKSQVKFRPTTLSSPLSGASKANFNEKPISKPNPPKTGIESIFQPINPVVNKFVELSNYMPYNVATNLVSLKVNISFLDVLRAPKKQ